VSLDRFTPAKLPCAYTADFKMYALISGTETNVNGYQAGYGRIVSLLEKGEIQGYDATMNMILRADIHEQTQPDGAAIIEGIGASGVNMCQLDSYVDTVQKGYEQVAMFDSIIAQSFSYDTKKENVVFNGQKCTMYSVTQKVSSTSIYSELYADSDNHVVGMYLMQQDDNDKSVMNISISYTMKVHEAQFMLDHSYPGCDDPSIAAIYSAPPKEANCPIDPN